jgi:hypothetical protein
MLLAVPREDWDKIKLRFLDKEEEVQLTASMTHSGWDISMWTIVKR